MAKAIIPTMAKAAIMGTAKISELPSNPPSVSDNMVVGSSVATETRLDDESVAVAVKISAVGRGVAFNGEVAVVAYWVVEGTKASADEKMAKKTKRIRCIMALYLVLREQEVGGLQIYATKTGGTTIISLSLSLVFIS